MSARTTPHSHSSHSRALSLPGTGTSPRGLFIGRSGALLERPGKAQRYAFDPAMCSQGAVGALFRAAQTNWTIYLIGNEDAVARGKITEQQWERFDLDLCEYLRGQGIPLKRHYACVDHPDGKGEHRRDSVFLFPNTGALYHAAQEDGIELSSSWVVAHEVFELVAGWRAGCQMAGIDVQAPSDEHALRVEPSIQAATLKGALSELLSFERRSAR